ncbi:MAG: hypothetical protein JKX70_01025 [Phycisphaerales bacterium]|nr:hypothetical protein [Phycisphaerales bacterium]
MDVGTHPSYQPNPEGVPRGMMFSDIDGFASRNQRARSALCASTLVIWVNKHPSLLDTPQGVSDYSS